MVPEKKQATLLQIIFNHMNLAIHTHTVEIIMKLLLRVLGTFFSMLLVGKYPQQTLLDIFTITALAGPTYPPLGWSYNLNNLYE